MCYATFASLARLLFTLEIPFIQQIFQILINLYFFLGEENVLTTIIMITTIQGRNKLVHYYTTRWQNFLCYLRYPDLPSY